MNDMAKNLILWLVIAVVLFSVFQNFSETRPRDDMSYSDFIHDVKDGRVREVEIDGLYIRGLREDGKTFTVVKPPVPDLALMDDLIENDVRVVGAKPEETSLWQQLLVASFPILLFIAVFIFFMRQMQGGGGGRGGPMSFAKSKARLLGEDQVKTTFADVAGVDEAKEDVKELVEFLRDPSRFQLLGGQIPRGVLMSGPPGTGKTLLAKAIAGEAKVPFFSISGSDFVEMFVGVGASRVRDMFEQAKKQAPCIIFIDEIDAVGRQRGGGGHGGGHDEREQTLNQLLVEMDGFEGSEGVIVIAATNRSDVLDKALTRPGRFDRQVFVGLPDIRGREQILKVHMRKVPLDESVNARTLARGTPGFSGADLANLINEAALLAARGNKRVVTPDEFEKARDKILMGAERRTLVMSDKEKEATAYHEAGHAIVGYLSEEHDPIHKVTIIPRGRALGVTWFLPENDETKLSKRKILGNVATLYGGRIAEFMKYGAEGVATGASHDIKMATQYVRGMVVNYGLSNLGPLDYDSRDNDGISSRSISEHTAQLIDEEVKRISDNCYKTAETILAENADILEAMKEALMEYETLDSEQVEDLMNRKKVRPPKDWHDSSFGGGSKSKDEAKEEKEPGSVGGPASEH